MISVLLFDAWTRVVLHRREAEVSQLARARRAASAAAPGARVVLRTRGVGRRGGGRPRRATGRRLRTG